jgi:hypothetical protein
VALCLDHAESARDWSAAVRAADQFVVTYRRFASLMQQAEIQGIPRQQFIESLRRVKKS